MTDNEKLARWQGWCSITTFYDHFWRLNDGEPKSDLPDYLNDDAAAMGLLDTLVDKGYTYTLEESKDGVVFVVSKVKWSDTARFDFVLPRREAVVAAVLQLIADKP